MVKKAKGMKKGGMVKKAKGYRKGGVVPKKAKGMKRGGVKMAKGMRKGGVRMAKGKREAEKRLERVSLCVALYRIFHILKYGLEKSLQPITKIITVSFCMG